MNPLQETHVVTCFLRNRGEVLLLRRSEEVGAYQNKWGGVAGHVEDNPDDTAGQEIAEETGMVDDLTLVRRGDPFPVEDPNLDTRWIVHPYLFDCERRDLKLDSESREAEWVSPTAILNRDTVPDLWTSYEHVAPSVDTIQKDDQHGAAYLSLRALEVLRDRAALLNYWDKTPDEARTDLSDLASRLLKARPAMGALHNRVNRAMYACRENPSPSTLVQTAHEMLQHALEADNEAAAEAARLLSGRRVLTLSRSGTVLTALRKAHPAPSVVVAASRPAGEGITVAERLADLGLDVTLVPDAAMAHAVNTEDVDVVLTGADTVLPSGTVINKAGTCLAALAARRTGVPCYAAAASDKIRADEDAELENGPSHEVYDGPAHLNVLNPTMERTDADMISGIATEKGLLRPAEIQEVVDELRRLASWEQHWS